MISLPENRVLSGRDSRGHLLKGGSGNPGAGPKGPAEYVREQTLDGEDLVGFLASVMRYEKVNGPKPTVNHTWTPRSRLQTADGEWRRDRDGPAEAKRWRWLPGGRSVQGARVPN